MINNDTSLENEDEEIVSEIVQIFCLSRRWIIGETTVRDIFSEIIGFELKYLHGISVIHTINTFFKHRI